MKELRYKNKKLNEEGINCCGDSEIGLWRKKLEMSLQVVYVELCNFLSPLFLDGKWGIGDGWLLVG